MKTKVNQRYVFQCDVCECVCDTETRDWDEAIDVLKSEGWASKKGKTDWQHFCARCG